MDHWPPSADVIQVHQSWVWRGCGYVPGSCHGRWVGQGGVTEDEHAILWKDACSGYNKHLDFGSLAQLGLNRLDIRGEYDYGSVWSCLISSLPPFIRGPQLFTVSFACHAIFVTFYFIYATGVMTLPWPFENLEVTINPLKKHTHIIICSWLYCNDWSMSGCNHVPTFKQARKLSLSNS